MILTANVVETAGPDTQRMVRNFAKSDPRKRDQILTAVGDARENGAEGKASRVAAASGHSGTQESRIRAGQRMSATGRAAVAAYVLAAEEDARPLEDAGQDSAFINATLNAIAMWPQLERLTTEELHAELRRTIRQKETRANGECNNLDADYLDGGRFDRRAMLEAHTRQAQASERIMAILQVLAHREEKARR